MPDEPEEESIQRQADPAGDLATDLCLAAGGVMSLLGIIPRAIGLAGGANVVGAATRHVALAVLERKSQTVMGWAEEVHTQLDEQGIPVTEKLRDLLTATVPQVMEAQCDATRDLMKFVFLHAAHVQDDDLELIAASEAEGLIAAMKPSSATVFAIICAEEFVPQNDGNMAFWIGSASKLAKMNIHVLRSSFEGIEFLVTLMERDDGLCFGFSQRGKWLRDWIREGMPRNAEAEPANS